MCSSHNNHSFLGILCNEHDLRSDLLNTSRHNPFVLPRNSTAPINVTLSWVTGFVVGFDEIEGKFTIMGNLDMSWKDELMMWNKEAYNVSSIVAVGKEVWTPPIYVLNKMDSVFLSNGLNDDLLRIKHTGEVISTHSGEMSVSCPLDPIHFPFDIQTCFMMFGLTVHSSAEVRLRFSDNPIQSVTGAGIMTVDHPIWTITGFKTTASEYSNVASIKFCLFRKSLYYTFTMLGPSALLNCLTIFAFLIPNDQGEKISCGMTIFLAFVVFLVQVGDIIPKNSNAVPVLGKYYLYSIIGSAVMVINTVIHSFIANKRAKNGETKVEPMNNDLEKPATFEMYDETISVSSNESTGRKIPLVKFLKKHGLKILDVVCFLISVLLIGISVIMLLTTKSTCDSA
ncbi:acetylcholine receptor subunit alpha-L1-like [Saccostrea cucullata]|uniref:acetylcholine receptor subunit alpha-L1-like n=1 Tax=Saccostrea cuccullata TaxID=36930 RepID=UPI002ED114D3